MAKISYMPTFGIVCLIDALGAKNFSDEDTVNFLKSRHILKKALEDKSADQVEAKEISIPQIAFFNDTIVIAIECEPDSESERKVLIAMSVMVRKLISDGISNGIFFRGAIGAGKYFVDLAHDTIIGQAVSDAASWYECTEFVGCIATPRAGFILEKHYKEGEPTNSGVYIPYPVPTKDGIKNLYCVNWPRAFFYYSLRPDGCETGKELKYLLKKISDYHFPKVAEVKFSNTIAFFKASCDLAAKNPKIKKS